MSFLATSAKRVIRLIIRVLKMGSQPGVSTGEFGESVKLDGEKRKPISVFTNLRRKDLPPGVSGGQKSQRDQECP